MIQSTFVIVKPDAICRGLIGEIVARFEAKGLQLVACKLSRPTKAKLAEHYAHLAAEKYFPRVISFMQSTPVLLCVWRGVDAVDVVRALCGETNGRLAAPGTLRGDLSQSIQCNVVHASDRPDTAEQEIARFFDHSEILPFDLPQESFLYGVDEA